MIHPYDKTLTIVPTPSKPHEGIWLNNLATTLTLSAAFGLVAIVVIAATAFAIRVAVGDYIFRMDVGYLGWVSLYLAACCLSVIYYALSLELPSYVPRWEIEKKPEWEDPYDPSDYKHFGR